MRKTLSELTGYSKLMVPTLKHHALDQRTVLTLYQLNRFSRETKEEEYFAKGLHDSIVQDQQDKLRFALDSFEELKTKLPDLHLSPDWTVWYSSSNTLQIFS